MNPALKLIQEKIVETVPEILEAKLGCEMLWQGEKFIFISEGMAGLYTIFNERCHAVHATPNKCVILGRPIRLSDVLTTLRGKNIEWGTFSKIIVVLCCGGNRAAGKPWNLRKDSLDDQSPETLQFIHSILCV